MNDALWNLSNVSLGRPQQRLADVTLSILRGVTAVIGPSGAGKTSLLNVLVGFERPDAGRITHSLRNDVSRLPIAWVPPDFGLWPHLNVRQHLETVASATTGRVKTGRVKKSAPRDPDHSADNGTTNVKSQELLEAFRLDSLAEARVERLSQGERSRLSVARALCSDAAVLVMDEPLVHVDPVSLDGYWRTIREQCRRRETSLVFSTHAPEVVLREAERVICLEQGRVCFSGPVSTLYRNPPTPRLARFLGPANWFTADEAARWLTPRSTPSGPSADGMVLRLEHAEPERADGLCLRPEQIEPITADGDGLRVHASHRVGSIAESELEHEPTRARRTIVHRVGREPLAVGTRVLLRVCMVLLVCLAWAGCGQSDAGPELPVSSVRTIKMPADGSSVPAPRSLTVSPQGELYVLDTAGRVLVYTAEGVLDRQWRMPESDVGKPEGVCVLTDGTVAVADTHYHRVVVFDKGGDVVRMFGELGEGPGQFIYPVGITKDNSGHLYVAEYGGNDRIQKFTERGEFVSAFGSFGTEEGQFQRPSGIVWVEGTLYVADAINNRVHVFSDDGEYRGTIVDAAQESSVMLEYPYDIALGPDGSLFLVEYGAGRVTQVTREGELIGRYGNVGRGEGQFFTPWGIAVDARGRVYVADTGNHRTVELSL